MTEPYAYAEPDGHRAPEPAEPSRHGRNGSANRRIVLRTAVVAAVTVAVVIVVLVITGVRRPVTAPPYPGGWSPVPGTYGYVVGSHRGLCPAGWRGYRAECVDPSVIVVSAQYR